MSDFQRKIVSYCGGILYDDLLAQSNYLIMYDNLILHMKSANNVNKYCIKSYIENYIENGT